MITKREQRVINAFINCIKYGEYTEYYAITLIEDNARYGWMSDKAKDVFYEELEKLISLTEVTETSENIEENIDAIG